MIPTMQDEMQKLIAQDLGIADMPAEQQVAIINEFGSVALKAATVSLLEKMPEDKRSEFAAIAQTGDPAALQSFLDAVLPEHDAIAKAAVAEEVKKFKEFQKTV